MYRMVFDLENYLISGPDRVIKLNWLWSQLLIPERRYLGKYDLDQKTIENWTYLFFNKYKIFSKLFYMIIKFFLYHNNTEHQMARYAPFIY
jgi:hypothetical protein